MKIAKKKIFQILAPILVIILLLALFGVYHLIKTYKTIEPEQTEQAEIGFVTCEDLGCPKGTQFIASAKSNVYHECNSPYAQAILPENRVCFMNSSEAEAAGYRPAAKY